MTRISIRIDRRQSRIIDWCSKAQHNCGGGELAHSAKDGQQNTMHNTRPASHHFNNNTGK